MSGQPPEVWPSRLRFRRRDRALARAPRVAAAALAGVLFFNALRTLVLGPPAPAPIHLTAPSVDLAAEGYAAEVATAYLEFDAAAPERHSIALFGLVGDGLGADLGMQPPARTSQRVRWARVVQDQEAIAGGRLITVAVQTDRHGVLDLSIPVRRDASGRLALAGYPALVGAPTILAARPPTHRDVADPALRIVAARAVGNYLARDAGDLQADLTPGARIALPALALTVERTLEVAVAGPGGVLVTVQARDADGGHYTLAYELGVVRSDRWSVSSVQAFPDRP